MIPTIIKTILRAYRPQISKYDHAIGLAIIKTISLWGIILMLLYALREGFFEGRDLRYIIEALKY